jgi:hypothetical protein
MCEGCCPYLRTWTRLLDEYTNRVRKAAVAPGNRLDDSGPKGIISPLLTLQILYGFSCENCSPGVTTYEIFTWGGEERLPGHLYSDLAGNDIILGLPARHHL